MEPLTRAEVKKLKAVALKMWNRHNEKNMPKWFENAVVAVAIAYKKKYDK